MKFGFKAFDLNIAMGDSLLIHSEMIEKMHMLTRIAAEDTISAAFCVLYLLTMLDIAVHSEEQIK
ncbi:MAG: hypothetical protein R3267_03370 [Paenisporosarcina sp.]|nr:hypothetical protein [Paenisporosarcina sp.]